MEKRYFIVETKNNKVMKYEKYDEENDKDAGQFVFCSSNTRTIPVYTKRMASNLMNKSYNYRIRNKFETNIEYKMIECSMI